jgi:hypothetical protein
VLDVVNPAFPSLVGEYLTDGVIHDIRLRDTLAFVCTEFSLLILNTSTPSVPIPISGVSIGGLPLRVAPVDSFAYVATLLGYVYIIDITDPLAPQMRGSIPAGGEFLWCLAARERFIYVGNDEFPTLFIIDATNPDFPTGTFFDIGGNGISAQVRDSLLFVGTHGLGIGPLLQIYDVSIPDSPAFLGESRIPGFPFINALTVEGSMAYVSTLDSGVFAVDVSNIFYPQVTGFFRKELKTANGRTGIAAIGSTVYTSYYNGLLAIDAVQPDSLREVSLFPTGGDAEKVAVRDSLAFIASGYSGLWILDVSNPEQPKQLSNIITGGYASDVVASDSFAFIVNWNLFAESDSARGLWVVNVTDPYRPTLLSHHVGIVRYSQVFHPNMLDRTGNLILVTQPGTITSDSILEIIDVSNPVEPLQLGVVHGGYSPSYIAVEESTAYLATPDSGLQIIDLNDPRNPLRISNVLASARGIAVRDSLAFVDRVDSFFVVDVSAPPAPSIISAIGRSCCGYSSSDMAVSGDYVYLGEGFLSAIDIANPFNPVEAGFFNGYYSRSGVAANRSMVYLADGPYGLWILSNDGTTSVRDRTVSLDKLEHQLFQNRPNPFNPVTTIEFFTPSRGRVVVEVFNYLGERVATIFDGDVEPGQYTCGFDGSNFSSGIYFYRLITPMTSRTRKMVLLK